jgi:phosphoribosyl 1,2-cyclic phosphodiesterase
VTRFTQSVNGTSPGGERFLNVTFHGVRGSTPCSCEANRRYGGNTACVALEMPGSDPVVLDLGTGLRFFGESQDGSEPLRAHALVSHLHWDHVQGLPFCVPVNQPGAQLDIYGPPQDGLSLGEAFEEFMRPPYFPVRIRDLVGDIRFHTLDEDDFVLGDAKVRSRYVPHIGATFGYRVELGGISVAYVSDHQQPLDGSFEIASEVLELADGADLLIHDAQYTTEEFEAKSHWGHCSIDYALHVANEAKARRLVLFHHDPAHTDDVVDTIQLEARDKASRLDMGEVVAASEGLTVAFGAVGTTAV